MSFWCHQFPPKNKRKQVDLKFQSSKVEFVCSFFGRNGGLKISFQIFLTFSDLTEKLKKTDSVDWLYGGKEKKRWIWL